MSDPFQTIATCELERVSGGGNEPKSLWSQFTEAAEGAFEIVTHPIAATKRTIEGTLEARRQGHDTATSLSNGFVRAARMDAPDLGKIPAAKNNKNP